MHTSPTTELKVEGALSFPPPVAVEESPLKAALLKLELKTVVVPFANTACLMANSLLTAYSGDFSAPVIASVIQVGDQFAPAWFFPRTGTNVRIVANSGGGPAGFIFDRTFYDGSSEMSVLPGQLKFYDLQKRTAEVVKGL